MSGHLTFSHFASQPVVLDRERRYAHPQDFPYKPDGLWFSVDGDQGFDAYVLDALPNRRNWLRHRHVLRLRPENRVLRIQSREELLSFAREHNVVRHREELLDLSGELGDTLKWAVTAPDWHALEEHYDGILIEKNLGAAGPEMYWYSLWDCASGVLWNLDALESLELDENWTLEDCHAE